MKNILFVILTIFHFSILNASNEDSIKVTEKAKNNAEFKIIQSLPDTIMIKSVREKIETKPWMENPNMPWIIALLISLLTILINILIAKINQKTSIRNIEAQIASAMLSSKQQIDNTKEIAIENIKNSQVLAQKQFNATLKINNRQDWLDEVRMTVSEFLTFCRLLNIEFQDPSDKLERQKNLHEKVSLHRFKLLLLLDPKKTDHKSVLDSIFDLMNILDHHMLNSKRTIEPYKNGDFVKKSEDIVVASRELLYNEWGKIQNL
jgi:hypothetical protein